jgi:hypothetical protein
MLRRVMFITIKNAPDGHADRMRERLTAAADHVDGIRASTVHDALPINDSPWTFVWQTDFADRAALDHYRDHRYHVDELVPLFTSIEFEASTAFIQLDG